VLEIVYNMLLLWRWRLLLNTGDRTAETPRRLWACKRLCRVEMSSRVWGQLCHQQLQL